MGLTRKTFLTPALLTLIATLLICLLFYRTETTRAQSAQPPTIAQVGPGSPLPVYVVNQEPQPLPEGFVPGSSWKFTTWTTPSTISWTATVEKISGGWARLQVHSDSGQTGNGWYYIPQMPGGWEKQ
jgi:hypothetical protein